MKKKRETMDVGTSNVFVDLGCADASERKLRVQLAMRLNDLIAERRLTQAKVAMLFGIPHPHVSELKNYKLSRFSSERLLRLLTLLDRDIEIIIRPKAKGHRSGMVSVSMAYEKQRIEALLMERMGENDKIVTRCMAMISTTALPESTAMPAATTTCSRTPAGLAISARAASAALRRLGRRGERPRAGAGP